MLPPDDYVIPRSVPKPVVEFAERLRHHPTVRQKPEMAESLKWLMTDPDMDSVWAALRQVEASETQTLLLMRYAVTARTHWKYAARLTKAERQQYCSAVIERANALADILRKHPQYDPSLRDIGELMVAAFGATTGGSEPEPGGRIDRFRLWLNEGAREGYLAELPTLLDVLADRFAGQLRAIPGPDAKSSPACTERRRFTTSLGPEDLFTPRRVRSASAERTFCIRRLAFFCRVLFGDFMPRVVATLVTVIMGDDVVEEATVRESIQDLRALTLFEMTFRPAPSQTDK